MATSEPFVGTMVLRPYTTDLLQVSIPRDIAAMLRLEAGNRMWVKVLDDGFAFVINGPMTQINPPAGRKENAPSEADEARG
jgi:hypothetical protein